MKKFSQSKYFLTTLLSIIFAIGVIGHKVNAEFMSKFTPYTLFFVNSFIFLHIIKTNEKSFILWSLITLTITFILEIVGVKTGNIFGEYSYGETLGVKSFEVPLIIGFNWVLVILGCIFLVSRYIKKTYLIVLITGILTVLFDIALEPIAIKLDYWEWKDISVPLQNYFAWFLITVTFTSLFLIFKIKSRIETIEHYFIIQLIFFILLNLVL